MNKRNSKSLCSEIHVPERLNVDTMGDEQAPTTPKRVACHICHGQGHVWRGEDTADCPNSNCEYGFVIVKAKAK